MASLTASSRAARSNPSPLANVADALSESLAPITLPDSYGYPVELGSLWTSRPAAIVFLRHYG